jgi:hypothetical protein
MILKFSNIIAILLTIFVIAIILHPFYKQNIEKFDGEKLKSVYDVILGTRLDANNYLNRIRTLKDNLNLNGTVSIDDYTKLINNINNEFYERTRDKDTDGVLEIKNQLNIATIQDITDKINDLNDKFLTLNNSPTDLNPLNLNLINSIRSLQTGINLNVKHLNIIDYVDDSSIYQPKIMIFLNNGCLTYQNTIYNSKHCEMTNQNQHFIFKHITNQTDFLNYLSGDYKTLQQNITEKIDFYIIHPIDDLTKCVKIDLDGISIEDCKPSTLNMDQRWISSPIIKKSCA